MDVAAGDDVAAGRRRRPGSASPGTAGSADRPPAPGRGRDGWRRRRSRHRSGPRRCRECAGAPPWRRRSPSTSSRHRGAPRRGGESCGSDGGAAPSAAVACLQLAQMRDVADADCELHHDGACPPAWCDGCRRGRQGRRAARWCRASTSVTPCGKRNPPLIAREGWPHCPRSAGRSPHAFRERRHDPNDPCPRGPRRPPRCWRPLGDAHAQGSGSATSTPSRRAASRLRRRRHRPRLLLAGQPGRDARPGRRCLPRRRRRGPGRRQQGQVRAADHAEPLHRPAIGRSRHAGRAPPPGRSAARPTSGCCSPASTIYDGTGFLVKKASGVKSRQGNGRRHHLRAARHQHRTRHRRLLPRATT